MRSSQGFRIPWTIFKPAVLLGVLLLAAAVGLVVRVEVVFLLGVAVFGAASYLLLNRHLDWGIVAFVPLTFLVPFTIDTGTAVPLNITILLVSFLMAVWLLRMLVLQKDLRLAPSPVNLPALLFILATTVSLVIGNLPLIPNADKASLPSQGVGWMMYVFSVGLMLLVANHLSSLRQVKFMVWAYLILGTAFTIACWPWGISGAENRLFGVGISGAVFWTLLAAIGFGQFFCNKDLPWFWRLAALAMVINMMAFSWIRGSGWISGWLPPLAAIYLLIWLRSWKWGIAATVIGALAMIPFSSEILAEFTTEDQSWSTYSRFLTWPILFDLFKISPIFGLGMAHYHFYTILYPIYGYYTYFNSHNNYWDLAVQTGVVGLAIFLWLSAAIILVAFRIKRRAVDGFSRSFIDSIQAGFIAILGSGMLADWFLPFVYNIGLSGFRNSILLWVFLGAMLSLDFILPPENAGAALPASPASSPVIQTRGTG